jgi:hypothetical protein
MWLEDQASSALNRIIEILAASAAESNLTDAPIEANAPSTTDRRLG